MTDIIDQKKYNKRREQRFLLSSHEVDWTFDSPTYNIKLTWGFEHLRGLRLPPLEPTLQLSTTSHSCRICVHQYETNMIKKKNLIYAKNVSIEITRTHWYLRKVTEILRYPMNLIYLKILETFILFYLLVSVILGKTLTQKI